ncbi:MAG: hypothetical protein F4X31_06460 [Gammaproteobacteria bacterium]|nr:DUF6491 family protein [Gammaproteobacteria bacterium]MXW50988.1 hypothetical protein [Gammaproteobacteria bacterium]MYE85869.1 hypothetical protein [Gammaproteobacteria bacterium]MYF50430.1 hypothetical protein [Gammaproteobacteria bacterium]
MGKRAAFLCLWAGLAFAEEQPALPADVEAILSEPSGQSDYAEEERCLPIHRIREVDVLDDRHVVFRMSRKTYYLVQLPHRCPGLRRNDPVAYETVNGMSVCSLDAIRGTFRFGPGDSRLGPPCSIPGFQEVTVEQLATLREFLRQGKQKRK